MLHSFQSCLRDANPHRLLPPHKTCFFSTKPYPITPRQLKILTRLGPALASFQNALNTLYRQSHQGKILPQIAQLLDAGKPHSLIQAARHKNIHHDLPRLIRPDLIVTENGFALCEIDSVPGGVGITTFLQETYSQFFTNVIGAPNSMRKQFYDTFGEVDLVISEEAKDYLPEWEWFLGSRFIHPAETYQVTGRSIYRFVEAFDHQHLPWLSLDPPTTMQPPLKPQLEEKLALALFWLRPLESLWRQYIGTAYFELLRTVIPRTWVITQDTFPWYAGIPGLEAQCWEEVAHFTQSQRRLVVKISGYHPKAWGARSVIIGHDVSLAQWQSTIHQALEEANTHPRVVQIFVEGMLQSHSYFPDLENQSTAEAQMLGRTRLCPYYFLNNGKTTLAGILATHCPADKKILHGMSDAILMPCAYEYTSQTKP